MFTSKEHIEFNWVLFKENTEKRILIKNIIHISSFKD